MNFELENQLNQLPGAEPVQNRPDGLWMDAAQLNVLALAELMKNIEARLTERIGPAGGRPSPDYNE